MAPAIPPTKNFKNPIPSNEVRRLDGSFYAIVTHAQAGFDQGKTVEGVKRLLRIARQNSIPAIGAVSSVYAQSHFSEGDVDYVVETSNGEHRLKFPNAKSFIVGGGNLSFCLCETIRDIIRGTDPKQALRLLLITDAVYDLYGTPSTVDRDKPFKLASCTADARAEIYRHLTRVFTAGGKVCGDYVSFAAHPVDIKDLSFRFVMDEKELGPPVGPGQRRIDIELLTSHKLDLKFNQTDTDRSHQIPSSAGANGRAAVK